MASLNCLPCNSRLVLSCRSTHMKTKLAQKSPEAAGTPRLFVRSNEEFMLSNVDKIQVAEAVNLKTSQRLSKQAPALGNYAFDDKYAARGCALPDRFNRFIGRRVFPGLRFFSALEADHHGAFRRRALNRQSLSAANHIVAIEWRQQLRGEPVREYF